MSTALSIITPKDLVTANEILQANTGYVTKYIVTFDKLLIEAKAAGEKLPPELDGRINNFLVSLKTALKKMEEDRKPFTQKAQEFVKLFTNEENILKNDLAPVMQTIRDKSVAIYAKEDNELREKEQLKLKQDQERINLFADAEEQIRNAYADLLHKDKNELMEAFEGTDADNIDKVELFLAEVKGTFDVDRWRTILPIISSSILSIEDCAKIATQAKAGKLEKVQPHYTAEITNYAKYLHSMIPARRQEIAAGKANETPEKLKEQQRQIDAAQQAAIDEKVEQDKMEQLRKAELEGKIAQANRALDKPKAIESYNIVINSRAGWIDIFKFYYTHSPEQDLGKIKMDQMKAFCEKYAKSNETFITSEHITYEPKYKAVAVKASAAIKPDQVAA
ncbi:MAG: hypothetical protein Q8R83_05955 [Legionellaceae bacterium]|nr:hypothetical protein [Legionellaceae bacterium]